MIGERENFDSEINYGSLTMRSYEIDGNDINAFYDSSDDLVFVLDNTINQHKPNVLLVINPDADKKWDEILSGNYGVDLETIRPKQDNKYQKLDIEYSGLSVYDNLIKAYDAGDSLEDVLQQLTILRNSAVRHSAMMRLNVANEMIAKTNTTIVKTKESIVRLQARLKTLRVKLTEAKKGIGRVPTKQSAAKILKLEAQIEALTEKLKRAKDRLKSAQRRLETATVDAELASELLNQSAEDDENIENKQESLIVAPKHSIAKTERKVSLPQIVEPVFDDDDEDEPYNEPEEKEVKDMAYEDDEIVNDDDKDLDNQEETVEENTEEVVEEENQDEVKPLFDQDPKILDDDNAFKPISFDASGDIETTDEENMPVLNQDMITSSSEETTETTETEEITEEEPKEIYFDETQEEKVEEKPVLESMTPISDTPEYKKAIPESFVKEETMPMVNEEKFAQESSYSPAPVAQDVRQQEPVFAPQSNTFEEESRSVVQEPVAPVRPMSPAPVIPPMPPASSAFQTNNTQQPRKSKPTFVYYLLLIILIILAVFTLWLYQRNITSGSPDLTPAVEQTESTSKHTFFKQKPKVDKPAVVEEEDEGPVFFDEKPEPVKEIEEKEPEVEEVAKEPSAPRVIDDVPARMMTSGQEEEIEEKNISEEDVLAKKPAFKPGAKYDEMFVAEDDFVEEVQTPELFIEDPVAGQQIEIEPEFVQEDEVPAEYAGENPFYDEEEAEYQLEQAEMYYEE